ncbi:hypothetical protein [Ramlibacter sp.]|uniref:hypothetical protein n=1 Tax=Ramlibacter sp. TaxID=1917967 RepID=UPI002C9CB453|nr:hypothetical protein [Ramlibacter sp.]HWI82301.1 hypothetical protein [Ramlibacter sp.]
MEVEARSPDLTPDWQRSLETAAALAREQLDCALEIVQEVRPHHQDDALVAAVMQAIALNQATLRSRPGPG